MSVLYGFGPKRRVCRTKELMANWGYFYREPGFRVILVEFLADYTLTLT